MGSQGNVLGGTMIIAGTAIGAGMLALPMISAGMWIYWSLLLMVLTWMLMLRASQAILEVNLHYEPGSSFHTLVQDTLGPVWSTINGLAVAFVLYILVYAYVSGGGSTVQQTGASARRAMAAASPIWSLWPWETRMKSGETSSGPAAARGFPVRKGSVST